MQLLFRLVHFTAQARFSLIQEAAPTNPDDEDYTSLKENRESYDPYCSLRKDDVDLVRMLKNNCEFGKSMLEIYRVEGT